MGREIHGWQHEPGVLTVSEADVPLSSPVT